MTLSLSMKLLCLIFLLAAVQAFETKGYALVDGEVGSEVESETSSTSKDEKGWVKSSGTGTGVEGTVTEDEAKRVKNELHKYKKTSASMLGSGSGAVESSVDRALTATATATDSHTLNDVSNLSSNNIGQAEMNGTVEVAREGKEHSENIGLGSGHMGKDITKDGKDKLIGAQVTKNSNTKSGTCPSAPPHNCPTNDCVCANNQPQGRCKQVRRKPVRKCQWHASLDPRVDEKMLKGKVIAYKIQWFNGRWSKWFVPGYNDIDAKYNRRQFNCGGQQYSETMRRMWSYFYDHNHKYIICI